MYKYNVKRREVAVNLSGNCNDKSSVRFFFSLSLSLFLVLLKYFFVGGVGVGVFFFPPSSFSSPLLLGSVDVVDFVGWRRRRK